MIATQDFAQLESIHGKEAVQSLISMCGTLIVGQIGPGQTAETLARALGSREVERRNVSISAPGSGSTVSYAREDLALYKPSELGTRLGKNPKGTGVVMALATGGNVYELTWPIVMRRPLRKPFLAAAWATSNVAPVAPSTPAFGAQGAPGSNAAVGPSQPPNAAANSEGSAALAHAGGPPSSGENGFDWLEPRELNGADASDPFAGLETVDDEGLGDEPSEPSDNDRRGSI